ncbi:MAG: hypothetical protein PF904_18275 [Kiritimatiellae bacterium]|nr:hypothetical protein [Kiritimatiellia bacterium]
MSVLFSLVILFFAEVSFSTTVDIPDILDDSVTNAFDIIDGTAISTNGIVIVFEGELSLMESVTPSLNIDSKLLASTQLYVQMNLFDVLPDVDSFTNAQAAVLAVFDESSNTTGTLYAITGSGASATWMQLTNNAAPIAVVEGATNLISVVLRYPYTSPEFTTYEYTVILSTSGEEASVGSQNLISPLSTEDVINSLSVLGEGGLVSTTSVSGDTEPLSSQVDFSVYQSTNGVFQVNLYTTNENGSGLLKVYAYIDGAWVFLGSVQAEGMGDNSYQIPVTSGVLELGQFYQFKVVDEEDRTHTSYGEIEVKSIQMGAVKLTLETFQISFNSEDLKRYKLLISSDINAPLEDWRVEDDVQVYFGTNWYSVNENNEFQGTGSKTLISVPRTQTNAFFKIILINE